MHMKTHIALLICALLITAGSSYSQPHIEQGGTPPHLPQAEGEGWYKQKSGTAARLDRVYFFNRDSGWAVGSGVWYKTTNGGNNWEFVPTPYDCIVADILNFKTAIATSGKYIKYTTDAGITWSDTIFVNIGAPTMGPLHAFSLDTIFTFVASREWAKTTDRGKTWTITQRYMPEVDGIHRVFFENSRVGYVTGGLGLCVPTPNPVFSGISKTTDGGKTWNSICTENIIKPPVEDLWGVWAKGDFIILVGDKKCIAVTRNGGINWDTVTTNIQNTQFLGVTFPTSLKGYISGNKGTILTTNDGGISWERQKTTVGYPTDTSENIPLNDIAFVDTLNGWACGYGGTILHTFNGGKTWIKQHLPQPLTTSVSPEPFSLRTSIRYELPEASSVKIRIYNTLGKELEVLDSHGIIESGTHTMEFDGSRYPEGTFYYQIETDCYNGSGKMTKIVY